MAYYSIEKRTKTDGSVSYRCTVGVKKKGKYIYRENRTFQKQAMAKTWGAKRVAELEEYGVPSPDGINRITVGELIAKYLADPGLGKKAGRTKLHILNLLIDCEIAKVTLGDLSAHHVIEHCRLRQGGGAGPATVSHDISYLSGVLSSAKPIYGIPYTQNPAKDARASLEKMGLIGKSARRTRRPDSNELRRIEKALKERSEHHTSCIPFVDILNFAILSCMRVGEVCKIEWRDVDENQRAVLVRDRKDPRKKTGNHMLVPLLGDAWTILQQQPKKDDRVFPYNPRSVTAGFQRVRNALGIENLRFHDMRREGASRLFEAGFSIEEVAQVTGHRNLNILWQVYTELYPKSLHEKYNALHAKKG